MSSLIDIGISLLMNKQTSRRINRRTNNIGAQSIKHKKKCTVERELYVINFLVHIAHHVVDEATNTCTTAE